MVGDIFRRNNWENLPIECGGEKEGGLSQHSHISDLCSGLTVVLLNAFRSPLGGAGLGDVY